MHCHTSLTFFKHFLHTINACGLDMSTCMRQFYFVKMCSSFLVYRIMFAPEISRQEVWQYAQCFKKELILNFLFWDSLHNYVCVYVCAVCMCVGGLSVCVSERVCVCVCACNAFFIFNYSGIPFFPSCAQKNNNLHLHQAHRQIQEPRNPTQYPFKTGKILQILDKVYCIKWVQSRYMRNGLLSIQFFCF